VVGVGLWRAAAALFRASENDFFAEGRAALLLSGSIVIHLFCANSLLPSQLLRLEFRMARDAYNRAASAKMYRNDRVVMENQKKQSIRDAATRHRSELGLGQNHQITMSATGSKRVDHRKLAKMEASEKTKEGLMLALRLPVTRDNENEMEGLYNTLLAHCATSGDWFGAVQA
jgi:hypothetical protein